MAAIFLYISAFLVVISPNRARGQDIRAPEDEIAFSVPRMGLLGASYVGLPQPLHPGDVARVRRVFTLQAAGAMDEAAREASKVESPLVTGAIQADRYLRGPRTPEESSIADWLVHFGDQSDASAMRALGRRSTEEILHRGVKNAVTGGAKVDRSRARGLFIANRDAELTAAFRAEQTNGTTSDARMAGGLAAWRQRDAAAALDLFESSYRIATDDQDRATAAFWAARASDRLGNRQAAVVWLRRAGHEHTTFYGVIARRQLETRMAGLFLRPGGETVGNAEVISVMATEGGRRAFALLQVGQIRRAAIELRNLCLDPDASPHQRHATLLLARAAGFSELIEDPQLTNMARTSAAIPVPSLHSDGGFLVDPPLIYAVVRHESNFHTDVVSSAGARGLMQIMPATARAVGAMTRIPATHLHDPAVNLALGQQYLLLLSNDDAISGNLLRVLAAYAQGLSGMKRWVDAVRDDGDPFLFLEAMPNLATKAFIEDTLMHSWRYASAMQRAAASLDDLAAFRYPGLVQAAGG